MLPSPHRMRSPIEFGRTVRSGVRAGTPSLVVHARAIPDTEPSTPTRVGFVVSRAVGPAVVRNRVKRRLRHLAVDLLERTPPATAVVVRALPSAATRPDLSADLTAAWSRAIAKLTRVSS